jgi:hypothetical protein
VPQVQQYKGPRVQEAATAYQPFFGFKKQVCLGQHHQHLLVIAYYLM